MARRQTLRRKVDTTPQAAPLTYAWYYSSNRIRDSHPEEVLQPAPVQPPTEAASQPQAKPKRVGHPKRTLTLLMAIVVVFGLIIYTHMNHSSLTTVKQSTSNTGTTTTGKIVTTQCTDNGLSQLIVVSISARHLWACNDSTVLYNSPVVTGMAMLAADATPTGTYHIYAKETNQHLIGSDSTGSWDDFVHYWMPFLNNQYGQYGFHDATWRPNSAFGNISPDSRNGSHGCVECPLATAAWLYNWAKVGTTVKIES